MGMIRDLLFGGLSGVGEAVASVGRVFVGDKAAGQAPAGKSRVMPLKAPVRP